MEEYDGELYEQEEENDKEIKYSEGKIDLDSLINQKEKKGD